MAHLPDYGLARETLGSPEIWDLLPVIDKTNICFKIWKFPSFKPWRMFLVSKRKDSFDIRLGQWSPAQDYQEMSDVPKIVCRLGYVNAVDISIPLLDSGLQKRSGGKERIITIDGTQCGFTEYNNGEICQHFEWCYGEWDMTSSTKSWFDGKIADLENYFPSLG